MTQGHLKDVSTTVARTVADLPGPRGLPLLGNVLAAASGRLHLELEEWARTYGPLYRMQMGLRRVVVASDQATVAEMLRARPHLYRRIGNLEPVFAELDVPGVFSTEGEAWRRQRRLIAQALAQGHLNSFYPILLRVLQRLQRRWLASAGTVLDLVSELKRFTVDVTTLLAFNYDVNTLENGADSLQQQLEVVLPTVHRRLTAPFPLWRLVRMPADRRTERAVATLKLRLKELIAQARQGLLDHPERNQAPTNFLEAMLAARDEAGQPFSDELLFGNVVQVLLAGEDTTAATVAWAVHELLNASDQQVALQAEVEGVLGAELLPGEIETTHRLPYTNAVVQEALRLRSVAPLLFLENNETVVLDGTEIPQGSWLFVLTRVAALNEQSVERAREFLPGRWLDAGKPIDAKPPTNHFPFGSGPRVCPGRWLAMLEMRMVLAMLYRNFELERVGRASAVRDRFAFIVEPEGLHVRLRPRRAAGTLS